VAIRLRRAMKIGPFGLKNFKIRIVVAIVAAIMREAPQ
jgi:hypothetical protein